MQTQKLQFNTFGEGMPGLPGRNAYPQHEDALWAGLDAFTRALSPAALEVMLNRQPDLRSVLLQRAAASLSVRNDPDFETTARALQIATRVMQVWDD